MKIKITNNTHGAEPPYKQQTQDLVAVEELTHGEMHRATGGKSFWKKLWQLKFSSANSDELAAG